MFSSCTPLYTSRKSSKHSPSFPSQVQLNQRTFGYLPALPGILSESRKRFKRHPDHLRAPSRTPSLAPKPLPFSSQNYRPVLPEALPKFPITAGGPAQISLFFSELQEFALSNWLSAFYFKFFFQRVNFWIYHRTRISGFILFHERQENLDYYETHISRLIIFHERQENLDYCETRISSLILFDTTHSKVENKDYFQNWFSGFIITIKTPNHHLPELNSSQVLSRQS